MKSTLADNKQLFNVKAIAYSTTLDNLADGQFGIYAEDSNTSIASGTVYSTLPQKFRIVSKLNGKLYYSFDTIDKSQLQNQVAKAYVAEQINIWEGTITNCDCINGIVLKLNIDEQGLIQRDGLTWTHSDFVVAVSPKELACACGCACGDDAHTAYENNVLTQLLYQKIIALNSPYYTAGSIKMDLTGLVTYANQGALDTAVPAPVAGDTAIVTGAGVKVYTGSAWLVVGTVAGVLTEAGVTAYIAATKARNTDDDTTNDGQLFKLVVQGKPQPAGTYKDLEVNYIYPRGVKLNPSISMNGNESAIAFTQTQALRYEIGAGYDLRAEEFESMSLYTNLNHYPRLSDGIASGNLVYQFENGVNYNTVTVEFDTPKTERNSGDKRLFGILFGTNDNTIFGVLTALFIP